MSVVGSNAVVRFVQPEKADVPMLVMPSGRLMAVSFLQPRKAQGPTAVTVSGKVVFWQPSTIVFVAVCTTALQPSRESYTVLPGATVMASIDGQPWNDVAAMEVTVEADSAQ